jgi:hypothetical protein
MFPLFKADKILLFLILEWDYLPLSYDDDVLGYALPSNF